MFKTLQTKFSGLPRGLQFALALVAGVASFLLAFKTGTRGGDPIADAQSMMAKPASSAKPTAGAASPNPAQAVASQEPASTPVPSRLTPGILQNPFAPLNLNASMDKSVVVAVAEPKPEKKPTPKPPPPPIAPPPPPPQVQAPPTAPPLPFVVVGSIRGQGIARGKPVVFLNDKGVSLVVTQGDDIHGTYKVEEINASTIVFTYLPLGQRQYLPLAK